MPSHGWLAALDELAAREIALKFRTGGPDGRPVPDARRSWPPASRRRWTASCRSSARPGCTTPYGTATTRPASSTTASSTCCSRRAPRSTADVPDEVAQVLDETDGDALASRLTADPDAGRAHPPMVHLVRVVQRARGARGPRRAGAAVVTATWVEGRRLGVRRRQPALRGLLRGRRASRGSAYGSATTSSTSQPALARRLESSRLRRGADPQPVPGARASGLARRSRLAHGAAHRRGAARGRAAADPAGRGHDAPAVRGRRLRRLLLLAPARHQRRQDLPARRRARCCPTGATCPSATTVAPARSWSPGTDVQRPARPAEGPDERGTRRTGRAVASTSRPSSGSSSARRRSMGAAGADRGLRRPRVRRDAAQRLVGARHPGLGVRPARAVPRQVVRHLDQRVGHPAGGARRGARRRCPARTPRRWTTCGSTSPPATTSPSRWSSTARW